MSETKAYYDNNAKAYYNSTINANFSDAYSRFIKYLPECARVIDMGCGSGRDVKALCDKGFDAVGLDESEKLAEIAKAKLDIDVITADMSTWISDVPFDAVWCCASLLHLHEDEVSSFFNNLQYNLKSGGVIFISAKEGEGHFTDDKGRYMKLFAKKELDRLLDNAGIDILDYWQTKDSLGRQDISWLNYIGRRQ